MEVNRKLNAAGAVIGAVGIFGIIISLMILMNSIQYMRGITDRGQITLDAQTAFQIGEEYYMVYRAGDTSYVVEVPISKQYYEDVVVEELPPIERRVYEDIAGTYFYYEDLNAKPLTVVEEVGLPFKLPIIIMIVSLAICVGGFLWAFNGKPSEGRDLGDKLLEKREAEEAAEKENGSEGDEESSDEKDVEGDETSSDEKAVEDDEKSSEEENAE